MCEIMGVNNKCNGCMCVTCKRRIDGDCSMCMVSANSNILMMCENYMGTCSAYLGDTNIIDGFEFI